MAKTHWKKLTNPDYIGAYALDPGKDLTVTIKNVCVEKVVGADGKKEDCTVAHFVENRVGNVVVKPMILNTTNSKTIEKLYKTPYIEEWAGRKIQLYVASVKAFGDVVDALRIRAKVPEYVAAPSGEVPPCADCGGKIEGYDEKHNAAYMAAYTHKHYGKSLCSTCATIAKAAEDALKVADPLAGGAEKTGTDKPAGDKPKEDELI